jgi:hypothetical protein
VVEAGETFVNVLSGRLPRILRWNGRDELPLIRLGRGVQLLRPNISGPFWGLTRYGWAGRRRFAMARPRRKVFKMAERGRDAVPRLPE